MNQRRMVKIMSRNAEERLRYHNVMESSFVTIPLFRHHLSIAMREEQNQHVAPTKRTLQFATARSHPHTSTMRPPNTKEHPDTI